MTRFKADRAAYVRHHAWLAVGGMIVAMVLLWLMDNPHFWTGAPAGLLAIALRGWYLASEELAVVWHISDGILTGPSERAIPLTEVQTVRSMGGFVQVITRTGEKYLIKYQRNPRDIIAQINAAQHTRVS